MFAAIRNFDDDLPTGQISTDQTGRFPILSNRGNQYIMVMYAYDHNAILVEPMKNKCTTDIIATSTILHDRLYRAGITPLYQKLDNETPVAFKNASRILVLTTSWYLLTSIDAILLKGLSGPLRITSSRVFPVPTLTFQCKHGAD